MKIFPSRRGKVSRLANYSPPVLPISLLPPGFYSIHIPHHSWKPAGRTGGREWWRICKWHLSFSKRRSKTSLPLLLSGSWPELEPKCSFFIVYERFNTTAMLSSQVKPWRGSFIAFDVLWYSPLTQSHFHYKGIPFFISKTSYLDDIRLKLLNRLKRGKKQ